MTRKSIQNNKILGNTKLEINYILNKLIRNIDKFIYYSGSQLPSAVEELTL